MRLLFTPPQAGRRRGQGWGGPFGPAAPGAFGSARLGQAAPTPRRGGARSRLAGRPPGGGAPGAGPAWLPLAALRPPRPPGNLPRGFTRVHTSRVTARGSPGVSRVSPGRGGSPELRPPLTWDSPAPWPGSPRAGCDFIPVPSEERGASELEAASGSPPGPSAAHQETGSCFSRRCPN